LASSLLSNQGLNTGTVTRATSTTLAAGYVISQSPVAGTSVASCSSVSLVVSSGPPPLVKIPNEVGHTQAAAVSALVDAELTVGVTQQASSSVTEGDVISQNPAAGTSAAVGTRVSLVISRGKPKVTIPSEVGDTQAVAIAALQRAGLVAGVLTHETSTHIAAGSVISETPAAGSVVMSGSTVNLVISSGRPVVLVPNESGLTQAEATASLTGKGLVLGTITRALSTTVAAGKVVSQSPVSGTSVLEGTAVALKISSGSSKVALRP
jgi:serine/threonine-protein kinase